MSSVEAGRFGFSAGLRIPTCTRSLVAARLDGTLGPHGVEYRGFQTWAELGPLGLRGG